MISVWFQEKNKAFSVVLFIELWERFGYYGMQSILVLFLIQHMKFNDHNANLLVGAFSAMTYAAPILGGWVGDKVTGNKRAMLIGSIILALGYLLLAFATSYTQAIYLAMAIISIGNGLFKPNAATMVRRIYENNNSQLDIAFTLYYMAVNVGSSISMLICPLLKDHYGWSSAFVACFFGLILGIGNYFLTQKRLWLYLPPKDKKPLHFGFNLGIIFGIGISVIVVSFVLKSPTITKWCVAAASLLVLFIWIGIYKHTSAAGRAGLRVMYILTLEGMLYFVFYQQMSTSLTLFAQRNVNPAFYIGSFHLFNWSPGQFQALNPIWIMVFSPLLAKIYSYFGQENKNLSIAIKFIIGFLFVTLAFFTWWITCWQTKTAQCSSWSMVWGYGFLSLGELLISGLGLAVIARYVPASMNGFMTGSYFMVSGIALYIGSQIANMATSGGSMLLDAKKTLNLYQNLFFNLFILAALALIILIALLPFVKKWEKQHASCYLNNV